VEKNEMFVSGALPL